MILQAQPWIADFRIAAAIGSFLFLWVLRFGFFLLVYFDVLLVSRSGFGVVPAFFVLPTPPRSVPGLVWVIIPLYCVTGLVF